MEIILFSYWYVKPLKIGNHSPSVYVCEFIQYEYTIGQLDHRSLRFLSVLIKDTMTEQYLRQAPLNFDLVGERTAEYMDENN